MRFVAQVLTVNVSFSVNKRRPLAYGVIATGSSIGGVIFPLTVRRLINEVGYVAWVFASLVYQFIPADTSSLTKGFD
jgi:hypothetical protein